MLFSYKIFKVKTKELMTVSLHAQFNKAQKSFKVMFNAKCKN